ncbi:MAG: sulfatase [Planctomycetota bacterium]|nr:sulfatase [Planctomycetota bacterium]
MKFITCTSLLLAATLWMSCGGKEGPPPPPNVLLVVVDTLRADHLTPYGYSVHNTTPVLQSLAEDPYGKTYHGMLGSSSWTKPGVATLFTGLDPRGHNVMRLVGKGSKLNDAHTLGAEFGRGGYATGCVMSNFLLAKRMRSGFEQGFDFYDDTVANKADPHRGSTAVNISNSGIEWITKQNELKPWMLVLHYFDPHASFEDIQEVDWVDPNYEGWVVGGASTDLLREKESSMTAGDRAALNAYYDEEIFATDQQIGRVFEALKRQGLWENTVVLFTSDHGEELGERGHIGHTQTLRSELVDLPFVVRVPKAYQSAWNMPESAGGGYAMRQIYPAMLTVAGLPVPEDRSVEAPPFLIAQVDFVPVRKEHIEKYVQKRALRKNGMQYILDTRSGEELLFDLNADPTMQSPLPAAHEAWAGMRALLDEPVFWEEY